MNNHGEKVPEINPEEISEFALPELHAVDNRFACVKIKEFKKLKPESLIQKPSTCDAASEPGLEKPPC